MSVTTFAELKAIRNMKSISQEQIGSFMELSKSSYNKRENGKVDFTLSELIIIASIFELTKDQIFDIFFKNKLR
jgi:DNA-binding XRE family transcriptional regulator